MNKVKVKSPLEEERNNYGDIYKVEDTTCMLSFSRGYWVMINLESGRVTRESKYLRDLVKDTTYLGQGAIITISFYERERETN